MVPASLWMSKQKRVDGRRAAGTIMTIHLAFQPLIALLAGILILVVPRLLNYVVAGYLILVGVAGLMGV